MKMFVIVALSYVVVVSGVYFYLLTKLNSYALYNIKFHSANQILIHFDQTLHLLQHL